MKIKEGEGDENPCLRCDKCNVGLRIGQAMELYELINDEILDLDKFLEKKITKEIEPKTSKTEINEIKTGELKTEEEEINTSSKQVEDKDKNGNNDNGDKIIENEGNAEKVEKDGGDDDGDIIHDDGEDEIMFPDEETLGEI